MNKHIKLVFALQQIENIYELLKDGDYDDFFISHLLHIEFEIKRQICCLTKTNLYSKIID